ncbi:MAG TPA: hypothetical protein VHD32_10855 [Candidatus Didemnitutus sp.]|nr:hypothetical protein [Candidatus Didemnitutus sp.]
MSVRKKSWLPLFRSGMLVLSLSFLGGCATMPLAVPPGEQYEPPPAGGESAMIKGSRSLTADFLLIPSWKTAFIYSVDGKIVPAGQPGWETEIPIPVGPRTVHVTYRDATSAESTDLQFTAAAGGNYVVKFESPFLLSYTRTVGYVDFWIADAATGKAMTATVRVATPVRLGWSGPDDDDSDTVVDTVDFTDAQHSRPPLNHGGNDHGGPSHGGDNHGGGDHGGGPGRSGPPSIPNNPRPGGGGNGGGGHSNGGGGGNSGGGHSGGGGGGGGGGGHDSGGGKGKGK